MAKVEAALKNNDVDEDRLIEERRRRRQEILAKHQQEAGNAARQMGDVVGNAIGGFEDAWVKFTTTGKLSFSDLTKSVLADLARIAARQAAMGIVNMFASAWGGGVTAAGNQAVTSGTSSINNQLFQNMRGGYSTGGYTGDGGVHQPAGVVHKGEVVWSQRDVARAGGVEVVEAMRKGLKGYDSGGAVATPVGSGMAAGAINVRVMNAPAGTTASASRNSQGGFDIEVLLGQVDSYIGGQVASGQGSTYAAMGSRFGLKDSV